MKMTAKQNRLTATTFIRALAYIEARKEGLGRMAHNSAEAKARLDELELLTAFIAADSLAALIKFIHAKDGAQP